MHTRGVTPHYDRAMTGEDRTPVPEATAMPVEASLREALRAVRDPEIGESIVDLGLIERIELAPQRVALTLVPTSATCPMADVLIDDARSALVQACPVGTQIEVDLDWTLQWTPERLSPALRIRFGW